MTLAPPLLLFIFARAGIFSSGSPAIGYGVLFSAWAAGIAALATSGWRRRVVLGIGAAYTIAAIPLLPFLGLLAVCSTGDCV